MKELPLSVVADKVLVATKGEVYLSEQHPTDSQFLWGSFKLTLQQIEILNGCYKADHRHWNYVSLAKIGEQKLLADFEKWMCRTIFWTTNIHVWNSGSKNVEFSHSRLVDGYQKVTCRSWFLETGSPKDSTMTFQVGVGTSFCVRRARFIESIFDVLHIEPIWCLKIWISFCPIRKNWKKNSETSARSAVVS